LEKYSDLRGTTVALDGQGFESINFVSSRSIFVTNPSQYTLRGMHYQIPPLSETKIVLCLRGQVFDALVNIDGTSQNFQEVHTYLLGESCEYHGLLIPKNYAHGYLTMQSDTDLFYYFDKPYSVEHSRRINWASPELNISWPVSPTVISDKDSQY
jgi:dTDP-4-dehydrorhamnose 3,5-epimerase